jgi:hypothetical protein
MTILPSSDQDARTDSHPGTRSPFNTPYPLLNMWQSYTCARQGIERMLDYIAQGTSDDSELVTIRDEMVRRLTTCATLLHEKLGPVATQRWREEQGAFEAKHARYNRPRKAPRRVLQDAAD